MTPALLQCCQPPVFVRISTENWITVRITEISKIHPEKRKIDAVVSFVCLALAFFLSFVPTWRVSVLATAAWSQKESLQERKLRKAYVAQLATQEQCDLQDIMEFNYCPVLQR